MPSPAWTVCRRQRRWFSSACRRMMARACRYAGAVHNAKASLTKWVGNPDIP